MIMLAGLTRLNDLSVEFAIPAFLNDTQATYVVFCSAVVFMLILYFSLVELMLFTVNDFVRTSVLFVVLRLKVPEMLPVLQSVLV
jgi:hypothetical protein